MLTKIDTPPLFSKIFIHFSLAYKNNKESRTKIFEHIQSEKAMNIKTKSII